MESALVRKRRGEMGKEEDHVVKEGKTGRKKP